MTINEFEKLTIKEKLEHFKKLNIEFIARDTAENILFKEKEYSDDMLICFYNNHRSEWAILKRLRVFSRYIEVQYLVINANETYNEEADLIPIKKFHASDLFKEE